MAPTPPPNLPPRFVDRLTRIVPPDRLAGVLASYTFEKAPTFRINTLRRPESRPTESGRSAGPPTSARGQGVADPTPPGPSAPARPPHSGPVHVAADLDDVDAAVLAELATDGVIATPAAGLPHIYRARPSDRRALVRSPATADGRIYIQNLSSLLAAPALDVTPGLAVLDLAAAPGGKTLHLAALLDNRGTLAAVESARPRFFRLQRNLKLYGVACCRTYLRDGRGVGRACPAQFDRVLLDAPCSGEAQLGDDAEQRRRPNWSERKIAQCAGKQRALLAAAVEACRPGGLILYCTCTFAPEENEAVIADTLERVGGILEPEPVPLPACAAAAAAPALFTWNDRRYPPELAAAVRILPDDGFDAFFLCRLRKKAT